jgi:hypothetical protein
MVQIEYEIKIFELHLKNKSGPRIVYPTVSLTDIKIRKIIKIHNQQYPTWRLITTTPLFLYMLDYDPPWTWKINDLHLHA